MDEGRLTDSNGRQVDFKNTIIIMTSNVGSRELKDFGNGVGFNTQNRGRDYSYGVIQKALNRTFSPEFINRIDDIVMFDSLDKASVKLIVDEELKAIHHRIGELGMTIDITDKAKDFIVEKGFDAQYGARPLKRAIQQYVEDVIAEYILKENPAIGSKLSLDYSETDNVMVASLM